MPGCCKVTARLLACSVLTNAFRATWNAVNAWSTCFRIPDVSATVAILLAEVGMVAPEPPATPALAMETLSDEINMNEDSLC